MAADLTAATFLSRTREQRNFPVPSQPEIAVGYDRVNDVVIPFEGVSRRHARLSFDGKEFWIEDLGSANGTFLNAARLTQRERLKHLDVVTLGRRADLIFVRRTVDRPRQTKRGIVAARLEILDGLDAGARREIPRGAVTIGRSAGNNLVADSQLVSKVHARIERSGVELVLTDLQSANGTFVNGERVESRVLRDGDEISVGRARAYRVRIEEGEVLTGDVSVAEKGATSLGSLPMDWKTHMEWSPEEAAEFDRARAALRPSRSGPTAPQPAAKAADPKPAKAPAPPAAKAVKEPSAAKAEKEPSAAKAEKEPSAAKAEKEPSAAKVEKESKPVQPAAPPAAPAPPKPEPAAKVQPPAPPVSAKPEPPPPKPQPPVAPPAAPAATPAAAPPKPPATPAPPPVAKPAAPAPPPPAAVASIPGQDRSTAPAAPPAPPVPPRSPVREPQAERDATRALTPDQLPRVFLESPARTFPLGLGVFEIGRDPNADVRLESSEISRHHARITIGEQQAVLEDLKTVNGTFVNGQKLVAPRPLADGDEVRLGSSKFKVRFGASYPKK